jgi:hypothetical protein
MRVVGSRRFGQLARLARGGARGLRDAKTLTDDTLSTENAVTAPVELPRRRCHTRLLRLGIPRLRDIMRAVKEGIDAAASNLAMANRSGNDEALLCSRLPRFHRDSVVQPHPDSGHAYSEWWGR